ncbi:MAG TPA: hypothetical protein VE153_05115 [Myxococcus sp.]|nr:hypothetical protein [Myxococcus sp.]
MLNPHDRRDLAFLGLLVLAFGLVVAPVLHTVVGHAGTSRLHLHSRGAGNAPHVHRDGAAAHPHGHDVEHGPKRVAGKPGGNGKASGHGPERAARKGHEHSAPDAPREQPGHGPDGHQHLTGSVEHLSGVVAAWVQVEPPRVRWVSWLAEHFAGPSRAPGVAPRPTAMPQGP